MSRFAAGVRALLFTLASDSGFAHWHPVAKDGADLPPAHATLRTGHMLTGPGETADFEITPRAAGQLRLGSEDAALGLARSRERTGAGTPPRGPVTRVPVISS